MIAFELPWPPSVNHYYRRVGPHTLISRAGRRFREQVCALLAAQGIRPALGRLAVTFEVFPPDRRKRDLDNLLKSLIDALEHGGTFPDDSRIVWLLIQRAAVVPGGKVLVSILDLAEGQPPPNATAIWSPSMN